MPDEGAVDRFLATPEVAEFDGRAEIPERDGEVLGLHLAEEQPLDPIVVFLNVVDVERRGRRVGGDEEREPLDVVPVRVAEEQMRREAVKSEFTKVHAESSRRPVPPSQMKSVSSMRTSTQEVLPP